MKHQLWWRDEACCLASPTNVHQLCLHEGTSFVCMQGLARIVTGRGNEMNLVLSSSVALVLLR